jgi:hypothetical protein
LLFAREKEKERVETKGKSLHLSKCKSESIPIGTSGESKPISIIAYLPNRKQDYLKQKKLCRKQMEMELSIEGSYLYIS